MGASNRSSRSEHDRTKIAVLASGRGSNFEALCRAVERGALHAEIAVLISNVAGAGALAIAEKFNIPAVVVEHRGKTRVAHEDEMLAALAKHGIDQSRDWIVLAGYMRVMTEKLIHAFWNASTGTSRIVNVHPSLLPLYKGVDAYEQAHRAGAVKTGVTVHLVSIGVDEGPVLAQEAFAIAPGESLESIMERGLAVEHRLYPEALEKLFSERASA